MDHENWTTKTDRLNVLMVQMEGVLEATVNDRKKGGTKAAVSSVQTVAKTRAFSDGGRERL
jgi:hypothetical protein